MSKKYMISGAALLTALSLAIPAHAQYRDAPARNTGQGWASDLHSSVYIGLYGGYGWTDADVSGGPGLDVNGSDWGILAGYEAFTALQDFGLTGALEVYYGWSDADDSSAGTSIEKDYEWGVRLRPGLKFLSDAGPFNWKPYGILGYRRAEFETNTPAGDKRFNGFELGIGTELVANESYGLRLDYMHVFYREKAGINPDEDNLRLTLSYHF